VAATSGTGRQSYEDHGSGMDPGFSELRINQLISPASGCARWLLGLCKRIVFS